MVTIYYLARSQNISYGLNKGVRVPDTDKPLIRVKNGGCETD